MKTLQKYTHQAGFSMMEVLITMLIILIGLLGIVALQGKAQQAELEAYQRAQALIMLSDIVDTLGSNRATLACFAITTNTTNGTPFIGAAGAGHLGTPACSASTTQYNNNAVGFINLLNAMLLGASERAGPGFTEFVGSMLGARACINYDATTELGSPVLPGTGLYTVVVSWQAMGDLVAPAANCGNGLYGAETKRRAVSTTLRFADLY